MENNSATRILRNQDDYHEANKCKYRNPSEAKIKKLPVSRVIKYQEGARCRRTEPCKKTTQEQ
jgi:hypothetical protein